MKAVVIEKRGERVAVLRDDGEIVELRNANYSKGDIVMLREETPTGRNRLTAIIAIAAVLLVTISGGIWAYATPRYHVSLDVNPGIVFGVNMFDRVIEVEAVNEETAEILQGIRWNNRNVEDAVSRAIGRFADVGYFAGDDQNLSISASSDDEERSLQRASRLKGVAMAEIERRGVNAEVRAGVTGTAMVEEARALGITPGRLNIIRNLLGEEPSDVNMEKSIKDLMERFTEQKGAHGRARAEEAGGAPRPDEADEGSGENGGANPDRGSMKADQADKRGEKVDDATPGSDDKSREGDHAEENGDSSGEKDSGAAETPSPGDPPPRPQGPEVPTPRRP